VKDERTRLTPVTLQYKVNYTYDREAIGRAGRLQGEVVIGSDFDALRARTGNLVRHRWAGVPLIAFSELWPAACGTALTAVALAYTVVAWIAVRRRIPGFPSAAAKAPKATVLKALCGAEHGLYEHLKSFCDQDHAEFQIIFGVADANDEAVAIVQQLQRDFPAADLHLVIDGKQHGANRKVSNLINMACHARYDYLVVADSDIHVSRDYLSKVTLPLLDPTVGIVTCPYRGCPRAGLWSLLGSLFINDWFMPSVRVAALAGSRSFAFGSTIAVRRQVLSRIGGFHAVANQLADDYRLGELTRRLGLRTVLSDVIVETSVDERTLGDLFRHNVRWLRTIRAVRPVGHFLSFVTFGVPIALSGCLCAGLSSATVVMSAMTMCARVMLHRANHQPLQRLGSAWVLALSDVFGIALWAWSFVTHRVHWRSVEYSVHGDACVEAPPAVTSVG
jgi:ceramide glucosyltransferase